MGAQKGRNYLVQLQTGETFSNLGGMREPTITINNEPVDISNADSSGIRELLEGGGLTSVTIKGQGVYLDDAHVPTVRAAALANTHLTMRFIIPGDNGGTFEGSFMVTQCEEGGPYNQAGTYSLTLESAGEVTFE